MIASLRGEILSIALDHFVIECCGVGYKVLATPATLSTLRRGEEARVVTSMIHREDSVTLYGFIHDEDRAMFHTLQTVSGMGAKLALAALSVMDARELSAAIAGGQTKVLQTIPGVGKRMAERLALELKEKVDAPCEQTGTASGGTGTTGPVVDEVTEALIGLGFPEKEARPVVEVIVGEAPQAPTAAVLRAALSQLGRGK